MKQPVFVVVAASLVSALALAACSAGAEVEKAGPSPGAKAGAISNPSASQANIAGPANAVWAYQFSSLTAMDEASDAVVLAKVVDITPGRVVQPTPKHTPLHFTNVHVQVLEDWGRQPLPSQKLVVELTGGESTPFFAEQPPYAVGEEHLLFLKKTIVPDDPLMYFEISPQGRYRIRNGKLEALTAVYLLNKELDGRTVPSVKEQIYAGRQD